MTGSAHRSDEETHLNHKYNQNHVQSIVQDSFLKEACYAHISKCTTLISARSLTVVSHRHLDLSSVPQVF